MCSTERPNKESYEFFEDILNYIKIVKSAESNAASSNDVSECKHFMESSKSNFKDITTAKTICEQFIKLYNSLTDCKTKSNTNPKYKECSEFLNYWINFKLRKSMKYEDYSVRDVYDLLESQITATGEFGTDLVCIHNINMNDLNKMNILYSLYDKYTDIDGILENRTSGDTKLLLSLSTACCKDYLEARYICDTSKNNSGSRFCEKLKDFKSKYDQLDGKVNKQGSDYSNNFIKLEECPNTKIITTAVTGSIIGLMPLLGVLYKFTPMVQVLRSKMGILNNDISKNDEEMIKMSLMDQENEQIPFQKKTYNIKYQSL